MKILYILNPSDIKELKMENNTITGIKLKRKYKDRNRKILKMKNK